MFSDKKRAEDGIFIAKKTVRINATIVDDTPKKVAKKTHLNMKYTFRLIYLILIQKADFLLCIISNLFIVA